MLKSMNCGVQGTVPSLRLGSEAEKYPVPFLKISKSPSDAWNFLGAGGIIYLSLGWDVCGSLSHFLLFGLLSLSCDGLTRCPKELCHLAVWEHPGALMLCSHSGKVE